MACTSATSFASTIQPVVVAQVWEDLQTTLIAAAKINTSMPKGNVSLECLLHALQFLDDVSNRLPASGLGAFLNLFGN